MFARLPSARSADSLPTAPSPASGRNTGRSQHKTRPLQTTGSFCPPYIGQFPFAFAREHDDEARGFRRIHRSIVDEDGVGGAHQRRNFTLAITLVALADFFKNLRRRHRLAFFLMLFPAALGTNFGRGFKKDFSLGAGKDNGANIAAFHHDAASSAGALLLSDEHGAHTGDGGQARSRLRHLGRADFLRNFGAVEEDAIFYAGFFLLGSWLAKLDVRFVCELC